MLKTFPISKSKQTTKPNQQQQQHQGKSAIAAAESLRAAYGVPLSRIELTPMIGTNDVADEVFSLADTRTISAYALKNNLTGIHYWSFDRDRDCAKASWASSTCNTMGVPSAGTLGFFKTFLSALGLAA